jgi:ATP-dependent DNA ligase
MCRGGCAYEVKFDGWRCLAFVKPDGVYLQSRQAKDLTAYFPNPQEFHPMGEARRSPGPPLRTAELRDGSPDLVTDGGSCI